MPKYTKNRAIVAMPSAMSPAASIASVIGLKPTISSTTDITAITAI